MVRERLAAALQDYFLFAKGVGRAADIQELEHQNRTGPRIRAITLCLNEYIALLTHHTIAMKVHHQKFDGSYHVIFPPKS